MPVFTVEAPDGRRLKIEAADQATAIRGAQEHYASLQRATAPQVKAPQRSERPKISGAAAAEADYRKGLAAGEGLESKLGSLARFTKGPLGGSSDEMRARVQGTSLGWSDELLGGIGEVGVNAYNALADATGLFDAKSYSGAEYGDAVRKVEREKQAAFRKARPVTAMANELAGGAAIPGGAGFIGRATSLPMAAARSAAVGGGIGAVAGAGMAEGGVEERLEGGARGGLVGAAFGGAVPYAARGMQKAIGGQARPARAPDSPREVLMQEGVTLTPGQLAGGMGRSVEELAKSVPLVRDVIGGAERRGILDLNRAATNRALAPIGDQLPKDVKPGHDAIAYAQKALGKVYDDAASKVAQLLPDQGFVPEFQAVVAKADDFLDPSLGARAADIVKKRFDRLFNAPSGATGARWKELDSEFAELSRKAEKQGNDDAADMFDDARDVLRNLLARQAPQDVSDALAQANQGWANLVRVQRAARRAEGGVFSPAQLDAAVTGMSSEGRAASGRALMQDLSSAAREVMPARMPDSGTPVRALATAGAGGVGLGAIAPATLAPAAIGLGTTAAAYSRPVLRTINRAAAGSLAPRAADPTRLAIGQAVNNVAPRLVAPGALAAVGSPAVAIRIGGREAVQLEDGSWIWADNGEPLE